jgi:excisionase family DNA binding protein
MIGMSQYDTDMSGTDPEYQRVTVEDAARILGISENAVRKRIERGSLRSERDGDTRYVLLDDDMSRHARNMSADMPLMQEHLDSLHDQIAFLRGELERKDAILMSLTQRIPELEAPSEPREVPETAS